MKLALVMTGLLLLAGGCYWHYPPLALMVTGSTLLVAGVGSHFYSSRRLPQ